MCACSVGFTCSRCAGTPSDLAYFDPNSDPEPSDPASVTAEDMRPAEYEVAE